MMSAVEGHGHSHAMMRSSMPSGDGDFRGKAIRPDQSREAGSDGGFPGKGLHLGHMRGTAEGPPGLRPTVAADPGDATKASLLADLDSVFSSADGDADGNISRAEFYDFSELVIRDGLEALLAKVAGGSDGDDGDDGDDDSVSDVGGAPPPGDGDDRATDGSNDALGGVAAPPLPEAAAPASGDPIFDLTLSSIAGNIAQDGGGEAALALLEASQGYAEAQEAA